MLGTEGAEVTWAAVSTGSWLAAGCGALAGFMRGVRGFVFRAEG